jgi:predicted RNA polymerase sigma factor
MLRRWRGSRRRYRISAEANAAYRAALALTANAAERDHLTRTLTDDRS